MKQIVCDRCGKKEAEGSRDKTIHSFCFMDEKGIAGATLSSDRTWKGDLCNSCVSTVIDELKYKEPQCRPL